LAIDIVPKGKLGTIVRTCSRSSQHQHRSEYRSLAVMRNAHIA
jgi:hypothetical protein